MPARARRRRDRRTRDWSTSGFGTIGGRAHLNEVVATFPDGVLLTRYETRSRSQEYSRHDGDAVLAPVGLGAGGDHDGVGEAF